MSMFSRSKRSTLAHALRSCAPIALILWAGATVQAQLPSVMPYGARLAFPLPTGGGNPGKTVRDAAGNIYVLQPGTPRVVEIPVSGPTQVVVPSTDASITGLANVVNLTVDPAGNIYIIKSSNSSPAITEVPRLANGTYNYAGETVVTGGLSALTNGYFQTADAAVDSLGNIYIASKGGSTVGTWTGVGILMIGPSAPSGRYLVGGSGAPAHIPTSIAVDPSGNVFYADGTNVNELTAASIASSTPTPIIIGYTGTGTCPGCSTLTTPTFVFLDISGDIYVNNNANTTFIIGNNGGGFSSISPTYALPATVTGHSSYNYGTVDNQGNLLLTFGGSLELYGGGKAYLANSGAPFVGGTIPVGTISSTSYASPTIGLLFTSSVTLNSTTPFASITSGSAYGSAGTAQTSLNATSNTTCTAGTTYTAGQTCTIEAGYQPKQPGAFSGALGIYGASGNLLITVNLNGIATGPAVTVDTGTRATIGTGYTAPAGVAVDNTGAMYVADPGSNSVLKYAAGSTTAGTAFGTGLSNPNGVAIDPAGNLYIADTGNNRIVVLPTSLTGIGTAAQIVLPIGTFTLSAPRGVAVDAFGNIYVADTGNSRVLELPNPFSGVSGAAPFVVGSGFTSPYGLAIDALNNVYVADRGANSVFQIPGGTGLVTTTTVNPGPGVPVAIGSGLNAPTGVAVDGSGTVYVADTGNSRIVKIPSEAGVITTADQTVLISGLAKPVGIATDLTADLYVTDQDAPKVIFYQRSAAGAGAASTLAFGSVVAGGTGTQTAVVTNAGYTTALTESVSTAPATPFSLGTATSNDCAAASPITAGKSCNLALTFTSPATVGTNSTGSFILTDNALNATTTTQKVNLTGYTSGTVASVSLTGMTSVVYGSAETYTVFAKDSAGNPSAAANGTYTVSITGTATSSASVTLNGGTGTFLLPSLHVGNYSLAISVSGVSAPAQAVGVTKAPLTVMANSVSRIFDQPNPVFTTSYIGLVNGDSASVVTGTAPTIATSAVRNSAPGTFPITLAGGTLTASDYTISLASGTLTVTGSLPQTIQFDRLPSFPAGSTVTLTGYSTSGLPLSYIVTSGSATISGTTLTITAASGAAVTIQAQQAGNSTYSAAPSVVRSFNAQ